MEKEYVDDSSNVVSAGSDVQVDRGCSEVVLGDVYERMYEGNEGELNTEEKQTRQRKDEEEKQS